jgi:hypothetical protein
MTMRSFMGLDTWRLFRAVIVASLYDAPGPDILARELTAVPTMVGVLT